MCDFLGTDEHGFKKRHGWAARWVRLYLLRAILKYRHGSLPQSKLSCELAKQAVTTKCRDNIYAEPSRVFFKKPWISVPNIKLGMIIAHIQNINISNYGKKFRKGNQCHEVGADEV